MTPTAARVLAWVVEHTGPLVPLRTGTRWCYGHHRLCPLDTFVPIPSSPERLDYVCRLWRQQSTLARKEHPYA